jgi:hypothetical protein
MSNGCDISYTNIVSGLNLKKTAYQIYSREYKQFRSLSESTYAALKRAFVNGTGLYEVNILKVIWIQFSMHS